MTRRPILIAATGAALALGALLAASPAHAGTERSDGLNECMQAAEGGCSGGPFDGMGASGGSISNQELWDYAGEVLSHWDQGAAVVTGGTYDRWVTRPYDITLSDVHRSAFEFAYDYRAGLPTGSTHCTFPSAGAMFCSSPN